MNRLLLTGLLGASTALAQTYTLQDTYQGSDFFSKFNFFTAGDPTDGWTDYVDYNTAVSSGLISNPSVASWGVDSTNVLDPGNPEGRPSIRMTSTAQYNHGLFIADIEHMPDSICGLWPAYWFLGQSGTWPNSGEVDVIEGVNNGDTNLISAHTTDDCTISGSGQTSTLETNNCAVSYSTTGCSSSDWRTTSYGTSFNNNGGGVYAMQWTSAGIDIWFFPRDQIPASITNGSPTPNVDFGQPTAIFAGSCDIDSHFFDMSIVFDTTFCGSWAGNVYQTDGCQMYSGQVSWPSCVTYVAENPTAFQNAYWTINSIKVYQASGSAAIHENLISAIPAASTSSVSLTSLDVALGATSTSAKTIDTDIDTSTEPAVPPPATAAAAATTTAASDDLDPATSASDDGGNATGPRSHQHGHGPGRETWSRRSRPTQASPSDRIGRQ